MAPAWKIGPEKRVRREPTIAIDKQLPGGGL